MSRGSLFWGTAILLLGVLLLLRASGILTGDVLGYFWPVLIMLAGLWILAGVFLKPALGAGQTFSIDLQGAKEARIEIDHGAGQVTLGAGADPGKLLTGTSGANLEHSSKLVDDRLEVKIDARPTFLPFWGPDDGSWRFNLTRDIPLQLDVDSGASSLDIDLTDLQVISFKLDTGASSSRLILPAHVRNTTVEIEAGAASVDVSVPAGVAARIRMDHGLGSVRIDPRFAPLQRGLYQSSDYDTAAYRADISVEGGVGSVEVH